MWSRKFLEAILNRNPTGHVECRIQLYVYDPELMHDSLGCEDAGYELGGVIIVDAVGP